MKNYFYLPVLISATLSCHASAMNNNASPVSPVESVDLERYSGTWYEIAHLPFRQQRGCHSTTATYKPGKRGRIEVINRCRDNSFTGKMREAKGRAWTVDDSGARLRVSFFWPFSAPYWIIALDDDYQYAMVGLPNRRYLWILSRTPEMKPETFKKLKEIARKQGFEVDRLILTPHEGVDLKRYAP